VLHRALYYISHFRPHFRVNSVARDGGTLNGVGNFSVSAHDALTVYLLLDASVAMPNALLHDWRRPFSFQVRDTFALQDLRVILSRALQQKLFGQGVKGDGGEGGGRGDGEGAGAAGERADSTTIRSPQQLARGAVSQWRWPVLKDHLNRSLMDYQSAAVARMLADRRKGHTAHFLNVRVGLGKTLILLTYLQQRGLGDVGVIVYTMPQSAFGGVLREIVEMGLEVDVVIGRARLEEKDRACWERVGARGATTRGKIRVVTVTDLDADTSTDISEGRGSSISSSEGRGSRRRRRGRVVVVEHDTLRKAKDTLLVSN
jgi:hypothetical protein